MKINTITMPEWANYLSDFMTELPVGIFNKKITATGATTLALENQQDIILLAPDNGLIDNKIKQYKENHFKYEFQKINCNVSGNKIEDYISNCRGKQPVKLLCTYDSLHKLLEIPNIYTEYHLIIDEFHELLNLTNNRQLKGIIILDEFSKFKKYTFISATPIKESFLPEALRNVDYTELKITNSENIKVIGHQTNKPFSSIVDIIKNFKIEGEILINGKSCKHLYIYVNSVTNIANIIHNAGLTQKDVTIYCGDYYYNVLKLEKVNCEIGELLTRKQLEEHPEYEPSIHFITSKGFKGCDIYSNDGLAIYVINCHIKSTMSGMETLQQISGRIRTRTNPLNNIIYHIYNVNKASLTMEEFLIEQQCLIDASMDIINDWNKLLQGTKDAIIRDLNDEDNYDNVFYHYLDGDTMKLSDMKIKGDQSKHEREHLIYTEGIEVRKAYATCGYEDYSSEFLAAESTFHNIIKHTNFKTYCIAYNESITEKFYLGEPLFGCPEKTRKLIISAFRKLGYSKIQALKFHQTRIKEHLGKALSFNKYGVAKAINNKFKIGGIYCKAEVKADIQSIYDKFKYKRKATATDIDEYFDYDSCKLPNGNKGIKPTRWINNINFKATDSTDSVALTERAA